MECCNLPCNGQEKMQLTMAKIVTIKKIGPEDCDFPGPKDSD